MEEAACLGWSRDSNGSFPKLGVPILGVPIIRTIVFWSLYWGPRILGNYQISTSSAKSDRGQPSADTPPEVA